MARSNFTRGLVTGAVIGATVSMMINPMEGKDRRVMRKKTKKFMNAIGNIVDDIMDLRR